VIDLFSPDGWVPQPGTGAHSFEIKNIASGRIYGVTGDGQACYIDITPERLRVLLSKVPEGERALRRALIEKQYLVRT